MLLEFRGFRVGWGTCFAGILGGFLGILGGFFLVFGLRYWADLCDFRVFARGTLGVVWFVFGYFGFWGTSV